MSVTRFRTRPRPDSEVVDALERLLEAARNGSVRSVALVAVNPLHEAETISVGSISGIDRTVLIGGLSVAAHELLLKNN